MSAHFCQKAYETAEYIDAGLSMHQRQLYQYVQCFNSLCCFTQHAKEAVHIQVSTYLMQFADENGSKARVVSCHSSRDLSKREA